MGRWIAEYFSKATVDYDETTHSAVSSLQEGIITLLGLKAIIH